MCETSLNADLRVRTARNNVDGELRADFTTVLDPVWVVASGLPIVPMIPEVSNDMSRPLRMQTRLAGAEAADGN